MATGLNNLGQVVGYSEIDSSSTEAHGFLWDPQAGMTDLGSLGGNFSRALGINDSGWVVGFAWNAQGQEVAFVWRPGIGTQALASGGMNAEAHAVSNSGVIVGTIESRPVRWASPGAEPVELGHVLWQGSAAAVNAAGQVAGWSDLPGQMAWNEAVLWNPDGSFVQLGTFSSAGSDARDMNDAGEVVGQSAHGPFDPIVGVLWDANQHMLDLNSVLPAGWSIMTASGINTRGDVVGAGFDGTTAQPVVLWNRDPAAAGDRPTIQAGSLSIRVTPSPARGPVRLLFDNATTGEARVVVTDAAGRRIGTFTRSVPSGPASIAWDPPRDASGWVFFQVALPSGETAGAKELLLP